MAVAAQHEPLLADRAHLSFKLQRIGGTHEGSGYNGVVVEVRRRGGIAVIPPEARPEVDGEQPVDDRIQAGVDEPEDEQDVGQRVGDLPLQVVGKEPVPQAQQVVRSPADDEGRHDHYTHF